MSTKKDFEMTARILRDVQKRIGSKDQPITMREQFLMRALAHDYEPRFLAYAIEYVLSGASNSIIGAR